MPDYVAARLNMIEAQVRANDVSDVRLQDAMAEIPRERFVPQALRSLAYMDRPIEVSHGRFMMDPRSFAKLAHLAAVEAQDLVLVIGCTTGYSAAVLARIANTVVALEEDPDLVRIAGDALSALSIVNAAVVAGPLNPGLPAQGPYDVIFVDGAVAEPPAAWIKQLKDGGRLVAIISEGPVGRGELLVRAGEGVSRRAAFDATVPLIPGFQRKRGFVF